MKGPNDTPKKKIEIFHEHPIYPVHPPFHIGDKVRFTDEAKKFFREMDKMVVDSSNPPLTDEELNGELTVENYIPYPIGGGKSNHDKDDPVDLVVIKDKNGKIVGSEKGFAVDNFEKI